MNILVTYQKLKANPNMDMVPHTWIFGAKAAPGYYFAKEVIQFIHTIGNMINNDPTVGDRMKVVFLENYRATVAEKLMPAAEVSQQISLAGTEASGTGNMKLMINGALTLGTLDGANVEICDAVGRDNMFLFGMTTPEVESLKRSGYRPRNYYEHNPELRAAIDSMMYSSYTNMHIKNIADSLLNRDPYMVLADFADYASAQQQLVQLYRDPLAWNRKSLINIAGAGVFAADRSIRDYATTIWGAERVSE
jgi:starch phosphorylase